MMPGALEGIEVLDLTLARAGPTCVRQLSDMGATVVQVGSPARADLQGSDAWNLHRAKRSVLLDLKQPAAYEAFLRLVRRADVLVENFRTPVKTRLRIDYPTLERENPRLVYGSISGFGQTGPYAERPGVDQIAQGMAGLMSVTGPPGGGPWRAGIAISDTAAGTFLAQAIIAALFARERTGRGQWVHTSLLEAMINFMDFQAVRWLIDGEVPAQAGNDHPTIFPMGTYRTADGHLNIAASFDWTAFTDALEAPELATDPRFASYAARVENRDALREEVENRLTARTTNEWVERINAAGLPAGPVLQMDQVFADPQVDHLGLTTTVEHMEEGPQRLLRHPVNFSENATRIRGAAPPPGTHTREVLEELGYSSRDVDELVEGGAAAERRAARGWTS